jgi:hypothetical protein
MCSICANCGAIRDSAAIDALDFHVKALGTNPRSSSKCGTGERGAVIELGGIRFVPDWFLYSDDDGVVAVAEPVRNHERFFILGSFVLHCERSKWQGSPIWWKREHK